MSERDHVVWWNRLPKSQKLSTKADALREIHEEKYGDLPEVAPEKFAEECVGHKFTKADEIMLNAWFDTAIAERKEHPQQGMTGKYAEWWVKTFWVNYRRLIG